MSNFHNQGMLARLARDLIIGLCEDTRLRFSNSYSRSAQMSDAFRSACHLISATSRELSCAELTTLASLGKIVRPHILNLNMDSINTDLLRSEITESYPVLLTWSDYICAFYSQLNGELASDYRSNEAPHFSTLEEVETSMLVTSSTHTNLFIDISRFLIQITSLLYKIETPITSEQQLIGWEGLLSRNKQTRDNGYNPLWDNIIPHMVEYLSYALLGDLEFLPLSPNNMKPRFGPGANVEHLHGSQKWSFSTWPNEASDLFQYADYYAHGGFELQEDGSTIYVDYTRTPSNQGEVCSHVCFVPKDFRGPRVIALEPIAYGTLQLGIADYLIKILRTQQIGFKDQRTNQLLAKLGSITGEYATIDLKDASDSIPWSVVYRVFSQIPVKTYTYFGSEVSTNFGDVLSATRTGVLKFRGNTEDCHMFGTMGNGLTFPVEALIFWALCHVAMGTALADTEQLMNPSYLRVYGDDIIVTTHDFEVVVKLLSSLGISVNKLKTFTSGAFRESCGGEFILGASVKPVYLRRLNFTSANDSAHTIASLVQTANQLLYLGNIHSFEVIKQLVEKSLNSPLMWAHSELTPFSWHMDKHPLHRDDDVRSLALACFLANTNLRNRSLPRDALHKHVPAAQATVNNDLLVDLEFMQLYAPAIVVRTEDEQWVDGLAVGQQLRISTLNPASFPPTSPAATAARLALPATSRSDPNTWEVVLGHDGESFSNPHRKDAKIRIKPRWQKPYSG